MKNFDSQLAGGGRGLSKCVKGIELSPVQIVRILATNLERGCQGIVFDGERRHSQMQTLDQFEAALNENVSAKTK